MATDRAPVRVVAAPARALAALATGGLVVLASVGTSVLVLSSTSDLASDQAPPPLDAAAPPASPGQVLGVPARPAPAREGQPRVGAGPIAGQPPPSAPLQPAPLTVTTLQAAPMSVPLVLAAADATAQPVPERRPSAPRPDEHPLDSREPHGELRLFSLRDVEPDPGDALDRRSPLVAAEAPRGHAFGHAIAPGQGGTGPTPGSPPPGAAASVQPPAPPAPPAAALPRPAPAPPAKARPSSSSSSKAAPPSRGTGKPATVGPPRLGDQAQATKRGGTSSADDKPHGKANDRGSSTASRPGKR